MLKYIKENLRKIIDYILPPRENFDIVSHLEENQILLLPKAPKVQSNDWIFPLFHYHDRKVKAIVWELKYKENTSPLKTIGKLIHDDIISVISDVLQFDANAEFLLIPIPVSITTKIERGYNQSELIAKSIMENDLQRKLIYAPQWFSKTKDTPKQSHSHAKEERIRNLENCFEANKDVSGKYILLIDDVVTTGSTLIEARKTLLDKGAMDVFAFTIAH
jgi:ComF family protein